MRFSPKTSPSCVPTHVGIDQNVLNCSPPLMSLIKVCRAASLGYFCNSSGKIFNFLDVTGTDSNVLIVLNSKYKSSKIDSCARESVFAKSIYFHG